AGTSRIRRHFAHRFGECGAEWVDPEYKSESLPHMAGKQFLSQAYPALLGGYKAIAIDFEHVIEVANRKRIADVLVTLPGPRRIALEMQLASITPTKLQERTDDYYFAGVDVIWVFGGSANTEPNRDWSVRTQGYCYVMEIDLRPGKFIRLA